MGVMGPMGPGGFRRRGRRRGLVVGAAAGAAVAKHAGRKQQTDEREPEPAATDTESELEELAKLKSKNLITDEEYDAKRKQILGL